MLIDDILEERKYPGKLRYIYPIQEEGAKRATDFLNSLSEAPAFDFNDVVPAYHSHLDTRGFLFGRDAFCVLPPYPVTWCEASRFGYKQGCLATSKFTDEPLDIRSDIFLTEKNRQGWMSESGLIKTTGVEGGITTVQDVYEVVLSYAVKWPEGIILVPELLICFADRRGQPLTLPLINVDVIDSLPEQAQDIVKKFCQHSHLFYFGFSLLACRNITTELREVSPALQKSRARKGKSHLKNFYVLNVAINRPANKSTTSAGNTAPIKKRLHMVRGCLADYSQGLGLFGKYKGRYWKPAHVRGSADAGEIRKDYKINAPN